MTRHALVVRLDSLGDVLVCGPAVRAVAAVADRVTVLAGPLGAAAARLLPGFDDVVVWRCPWIVANPPAVSASDLDDAVRRIAAVGASEALVLTSFHQSALPTALLPFVTLIGARIPELVTGAVLVEEVFSWPGLAAAVVTAATAVDYPLLAVLTLVATAAVLLGSLLADVAAVLLDPRVAADG